MLDFEECLRAFHAGYEFLNDFSDAATGRRVDAISLEILAPACSQFYGRQFSSIYDRDEICGLHCARPPLGFGLRDALPAAWPDAG